MWRKYHIIPIVLWMAILGGFALPSLAYAIEIRIERSDCRWLVTHDGSEAAYVPGVDVKGRMVAPADVQERSFAAPDVIPIQIRVDLQDRFNIPSDSVLFEPLAQLGFVEIEDGVTYFNGQPLDDAETAACREGDAQR